jgi:hypothetical protein
MNGQFRAVKGESVNFISPKFPLIPFNDLRAATTPQYLVYGLVPRPGLTLAYGPPKSAKSFWVFDLAMHVARDVPYRGLSVRGGPVVYCAFEGADGFGRRAEAFRIEHQEPLGDVPFYLMPSRTDLIQDHEDLIRAIASRLNPDGPVLVVLDTLNRSLVGSESNDETMGAYIKAADAIRDHFNCAVIIVHHCGLEKGRPRGHTSLSGAVEAQLQVKREGENRLSVAAELMKDGPSGRKVTSKLKVIEIGDDDDGNSVTSCVVVPVESLASESDESPPKAKAGGMQIALLALRMAITERPVPTPRDDSYPPDARVTSMDNWRHFAYQLGIAGGSTTPRAKQQAFQRASQALILDGTVKVWGGLVWIPDDLG